MPPNRPARPLKAPASPGPSNHHLAHPISNSPPPSSQPPPRADAPPAAPKSLDAPVRASSHPSRPAAPSRPLFDPWNSSSTGHQRADNRLAGSTSWRESRNLKLSAQFGGGAGGGVRLADTVGAGSEKFAKDGRTASGGWERGALGLRERGQLSIWEAVRGGAEKKNAHHAHRVSHDRAPFPPQKEHGGPGIQTTGERERADVAHAREISQQREDCYKDAHPDLEDRSLPQQKQVFRGLCFYINGSTAPAISDHKLKHLLAIHGASTSIALGRRSVTHVILGRSGEGGAGGGLAGSKLQREISRVRGKGIKYVGAEWVVESVRAGRRLPEAAFSSLAIAPAGQKSVYGMLKSSGGAGEA